MNLRIIFPSLRLAAPFLCAVPLLFSCATPPLEKRFTDILQNYPATEAPLGLRALTGPAGASPARAGSREVVIMVHPGYSLFFRSRERNLHSEAKYDLLKLQLEREQESIRRIVQAGRSLIIVIPGNYQHDSTAPLSYTYFLNALAGGAASVSYIYSENANSGTLSTNTMVILYRHLQSLKTARVLIGGGYVGRCEQEFSTQFETYIDNITAFIVPELSSVSPDDISDKEARAMYDALLRNDYSLIRQFIERKSRIAPNILAPGQRPVL